MRIQWNVGWGNIEVNRKHRNKRALIRQRFPNHERVGRPVADIVNGNRFTISREHPNTTPSRIAIARERAKVIALTAVVVWRGRGAFRAERAMIGIGRTHTRRIPCAGSLSRIVGKPILKHGVASAAAAGANVRRNHAIQDTLRQVFGVLIKVNLVVQVALLQERQEHGRPHSAPRLGIAWRTAISGAIRKRAMRRVIIVQGQTDLLEIVGALNSPGGLSSALHGR